MALSFKKCLPNDYNMTIYIYYCYYLLCILITFRIYEITLTKFCFAKQISEIKLFSVIIDYKLNWKSHLKQWQFYKNKLNMKSLI